MMPFEINPKATMMLRDHDKALDGESPKPPPSDYALQNRAKVVANAHRYREELLGHFMLGRLP